MLLKLKCLSKNIGNLREWKKDPPAGSDRFKYVYNHGHSKNFCIEYVFSRNLNIFQIVVDGHYAVSKASCFQLTEKTKL